MSDAFAIAAVTAVLRSRINARLVASNVGAVVGGFTVSAGPPDLVRGQAGNDPTQINLFLHQVTPNTGQRNRDQSTRSSLGQLDKRPTLALDLHYLMTAYGAQALFAEVMLGHAALLLHEEPVMSRAQIRTALNPPPPAPPIPAQIAASGIDEQIELIRVQPESVNSEELSRMWSALDAQYRPSMAYKVSVALLESNLSPGGALPARRRIIKAIPSLGASITSLRNAADPQAAITLADSILIEGAGFAVSGLTVNFAGQAHTPQPDQVRATQITLPLTDLASAPRPGLVPVQVVISSDLGDPPVPHAGLPSNTVALPLAATFTTTLTPVSERVVDTVTYRTGDAALTITPAVGRRQKLRLAFNEIGAPATRPPRHYLFDAPRDNGLPTPGPDTTANVTFRYSDVAAGSYLLRLRVDGVDSPLGVDGNGVFDSPQVTI
jgi:Pvc16 N-terminal domain